MKLFIPKLAAPLAFLGMLALAVTASPALAQSAAAFYKGKTVTVWVGNSAGGG